MGVLTERLNIAQLRELAHARARLHEGQASARILSPDYELIGLLGEEAFAYEFGLGYEHIHKRLVGGDDGYDYELPGGLKVDIKTAKKPYHLLREASLGEAVQRDLADVLVLAGVPQGLDDYAHLIGWAYGAEMLAQPIKDFGGGFPSHYLKADKLRPMAELHDIAGGSMQADTGKPRGAGDLLALGWRSKKRGEHRIWQRPDNGNWVGEQVALGMVRGEIPRHYREVRTADEVTVGMVPTKDKPLWHPGDPDDAQGDHTVPSEAESIPLELHKPLPDPEDGDYVDEGGMW